MWAGFGLAGFQVPGIPTPYTAATQSRRKDRGSSSPELGVSCMPIRIQSRIPAFARRRCIQQSTTPVVSDPNHCGSRLASGKGRMSL